MIMRKILLILFIPSLIYSSNTSIFDFLNIPCGARPAALGSGFSAFSDPYAIFYNPAGIYNQDATIISSTLRHYVASINSGTLIWETPRYDGRLGVALNYVNYGSIERTDQNGNNLNGDFTPFSLTTRLAYARDFTIFRGGASANLIYENIDGYTAFAPAVDIGIIYTAAPQMDIAFSLSNIGYEIVPFRDRRENLPYKAKVGVAYSPLQSYLVGLDLEQIIDGKRSVIFGLEIPVTSGFAFRAGYSSKGGDLKIDSEMDMTAGLSFGFGVTRDRLKIDYSASSMVELGIAHQISVTFIQAEKKEEPDSLSIYIEREREAEEKIEAEEARTESIKKEIKDVEETIAEMEEPKETKEEVEEEPKVEKKPEIEKKIEKYDLYVVKGGDWLSKIAEYPEVYGKGNYKKWVDIYNTNKNIIKNPDLIYPGQELIIPRP